MISLIAIFLLIADPPCVNDEIFFCFDTVPISNNHVSVAAAGRRMLGGGAPHTCDCTSLLSPIPSKDGVSGGSAQFRVSGRIKQGGYSRKIFKQWISCSKAPLVCAS